MAVIERVGEPGDVPIEEAPISSASARALLVLKLGLAASSLIGLGVVIGASPAATWIARLAIVLLAALAIALVAAADRRRFAAGIVLIGALSFAALITATSADFTLSAVLLGTFFLTASTLMKDLAELSAAGALHDLPLEVEKRARGQRLEELAATELARARRHQRPLAVVTVGLAPTGDGGWLARRRGVAEVARVLSDELRESDVVAVVGGSRLALLLPETSHDDALAFIRRLRYLLGDALAARLLVGFAAFPSEEVTWAGLKSRAAARERPLEAVESDAAERLRELEQTIAARDARIAQLEAELADEYERVARNERRVNGRAARRL